MTAYQVRRLKKPGKYAVGGVAGLLLFVKPSGARSWVLRIQVGDRRPDIGLGGFPDVTLEQARQRAREMREKVYQGIDPVADRKAAREALRAARDEQLAAEAKRLTFDEAATQCHRAKAHEFRSARHSQNWINSLTRHASPIIGKLPIDQIQEPHVLKVLQPIWTTKTDTARRVRQRIESVLSWAKVSGYRTGDNPAVWQDNLQHALARPSKIHKVTHFSALPRQRIGAFMAELRTREGMGARALEFAILTAARSGEVRLATWDEMDVDAKIWTIPAERMKGEKVHRVPLSDPAVDLLHALPRFEGVPYVFASARGTPLSDMTISKVCRRMHDDSVAAGGDGYLDSTIGRVVVPHGFRSTFKDWARGETAYADEVSELALAHVNSDATRAAYARDELLTKRTRLMRDWAKFCGRPSRLASEVTSINAAGRRDAG